MVRRTEKGVRRTEKRVRRTEKGVRRTEKGVRRTEKWVGRTEIVLWGHRNGDPPLHPPLHNFSVLATTYLKWQSLLATRSIIAISLNCLINSIFKIHAFFQFSVCAYIKYLIVPNINRNLASS